MEGDLQRRLGTNLRAWRRRRGLSQEQLAVVLDIHRTYMGHLERGERNVSLRTVERLAARLGVDPLVLLGPDEHALAASGAARAPSAAGR